MKRRVVVTGMGVLCPVGKSLHEASAAVRERRHGIQVMAEWASLESLRTRLAAPVVGLDASRLPRKSTRSMGRVALLAALATEDAIADAALDAATVSDGRTGLVFGSTAGSSSEHDGWSRTLYRQNGFQGLAATTYLKFMTHTCAANLAAHLGIRGRVVSTCVACASASQAIGVAFETIRLGLSDVMLCGGAEELHVSHAAVFDILLSASHHFNDRPDLAPRPFDAERDGLVIGEGAGTFVLESLDHARARGARIHAEVLGFGTNCDGTHMTSPSKDGMRGAMELALESASLAPDRIGYVNAHAAATEVGDIAESHATFDVFGGHTPTSSLKSYLGHTLGACGAIEAALSIAMLNEEWLAPNRTLTRPDPRCAPLDYVMGSPRRRRVDAVMSNKFAFGGINTSLVFGRI